MRYSRSKFSISITAAMTPLNAPLGALRPRDMMEAPLRAIATALVRLAEEKPCIARLAVRGEERAPGKAVIAIAGQVSLVRPTTAPVCVEHQESGDLRNMDPFRRATAASWPPLSRWSRRASSHRANTQVQRASSAAAVCSRNAGR